MNAYINHAPERERGVCQNSLDSWLEHTQKSSHSLHSPVHERGRKQIFHFSALESDVEMGYYGLSNDPSAHQVTRQWHHLGRVNVEVTGARCHGEQDVNIPPPCQWAPLCGRKHRPCPTLLSMLLPSCRAPITSPHLLFYHKPF